MADLLTDHEETLRLLKRLSLQDFLHVGMDQIAYIRALPHAGESGEQSTRYLRSGRITNFGDGILRYGRSGYPDERPYSRYGTLGVRNFGP